MKNCKIALLLVLLGVLSACADRSGRSERAGEPEAGLGSSFTLERDYPFLSVPADARRNAWQAAQAIAIPRTGDQYVWRTIGPTPTTCARNCTFEGLGFEYPTSGRVNTIAVSPLNPQIVIVGAGTGGIWRSSDGGDTFVPVATEHIDLTVGSITFAPSSPSVVYAGMGDPYQPGYMVQFGSGILKSIDAGESWTRINNQTFPAPARVARVIVDPANPDRVYAAVRSFRVGNDSAFGGVYVSADGGVNWASALSFSTTGVDLAISFENPRVFFFGGSGGLYRSTTGSAPWQRLFDTAFGPGSGAHVAMAPSEPRTVYVSLKDATNFRILVSKDGGTTWSERPVPPTEFFAKTDFPAYLAVDPADANTVYAGGLHLWKSVDGATSWTNLTRAVAAASPAGPGPHVDERGIGFGPTAPHVVYFGNDGGLYKSTTGGRTFEPLNRTLSLAQFFAIAVHPADDSLLFGGTQDNGAQRMLPNSVEWEVLDRGDVGQIVVDAVDSNYVYFAGNFGFGVKRRRDRGLTLDRIISSAISDAVVLMPALASSRAGTLYFGTWRLWSSANRGDTWTTATTDLTKGRDVGDAIKVITVSRSDPSVLYTGSYQGRVMLTRNDGVSWNDITGTLPNRAITSIVTDIPSATSAFLTVSGFGTGHVFATTTAGASWTDISGNLPDIPVNSLLVDPNDPNTLYVGTDIGVFRSTSLGNVWNAFSDGLPAGAIVTAFAARPGGAIRLATYGRGAYELTSLR